MRLFPTLILIPMLLAGGGLSALTAQTVTVDKSSLTFSAQFQSAAVSQTLTVTSSMGAVQFSIFSNAPPATPWLKVNGLTFVTSTTPTTVTVTADPTGLGPGSYASTLSVFGAGSASAITVNVTFTVSTIGVNPSSVAFTYTQGGAIPQSPNIALSGTGNYNASATTQTGGPWLSVSPPSGTAPGAITPILNASVLNGLAAGVYQGSITVTPVASANNTPIVIPVTLTVLPTPPVTANPASLIFNVQQGGTGNIGSQTLTISTTPGQQLNFAVQASVSSGVNWITLNPTSGNVDPTTGTAQVAVGYALNTLTVGNTYHGTITLFTAGGTPPTTSIPVTLNYSTGPLLNVPSNTLNFLYELSGSAPADQTVNVTATSGTLAYAISQSANSPWLSVPNAGGTGAPFTVHVNPAGLGAGTYTATINITSAVAGSTPQQIPVVLKVSNDPFISINVDPTIGMTFPFQINAPAPAVQPLRISSSTGLPLSYTATPATTSCGNNWLLLNGLTSAVSGSTDGSTVSVSISTAGVPAGVCNGSITVAATVTSTGAAAVNSPLTIPVKLIVSPTPMLITTPASLSFAAPVGGPSPAQQQVVVSSTSGNIDILSYSITGVNGSSGGITWLFAGPTSGTTASAATGNTISVNIFSASLPAGIYNGAITLAASLPAGGATSNSPVTIPVTLQVTSGALTLSSTSLNFTYAIGAPSPPPQTVTVGSSTANALLYTAVASSSPTNWLSVTPSSGSTNGSGILTVSVDGTKLTSPGTYTGNITVSSPNAASPQTITVTVVTSSGTISAPATTLTFTQAAGGSPPAAQTIAVTGSPVALNFSVAASTVPPGGGWLAATPATGTTPGSVSVSVNGASLAVGTYSGQVVITSPGANGSPISVPVVLNVINPATVTTTPTSFSFNYLVGQPLPAGQTLTVNASTAISFNVTAQSTGSWLQVTPSQGTTPAGLVVSVTPSALTASTTPYTGTITISSANLLQPVTVPVSLTVSAIPTPVINATANAASYTSGSISPGENIVIFGTGIGPATLAKLQVSNGIVTTVVGNTRVLFDGTPAPMIYASDKQTSVMVPYGVAGRTSTNIQVEYLGVPSAAISYNVVSTAPGIYSLNQSGAGPGAALNQDGVTANGPSAPAAKGSVVSVFMTGEGQTSPAGADGVVTPVDGSGLKKPQLAVTATIGGISAPVLYDGSAPGIISGVMQVNVQIPAGAPSGAAVPLVISVGTANTQSGITISVQ